MAQRLLADASTSAAHTTGRRTLMCSTITNTDIIVPGIVTCARTRQVFFGESMRVHALSASEI
jgi:hypothetical protein